MQCSNCQFQNMPGVQTCGRCGASLQLASLPIDVHPPRAGRAAKRWRRWFPIDQVLEPLPRRGRRRAGRQEGRSVGHPTCRRPVVLLRMIVPGWAQRYAGRTVRGRWISWCYLGLLLSGLLFLGTGWGWLLLGLALAAPRGVDHGHRGHKRPRFPPAADLLRRGRAAAGGCRVLSRRLAVGTGGHPAAYSIWLRPRSRPETWCW